MANDDWRDTRGVPSLDELARFNRERAMILGGIPVRPGERIPLPPSGVGGDVMEDDE